MPTSSPPHPFASVAPKPAARPSKSRRQNNRREDILQAAAELFHDKGFAKTSTREIAAAAGMRSGSPFYHFDSKEAMLSALLEEGLSILLRALQSALAQDKPAAARLRDMIAAHLKSIMAPDHQVAPLLLAEFRSLGGDARRRVIALEDQCSAAWDEIIQALHQEGALQRRSPIERHLMLGAINQVSLWYRPHLSMTLDDIVDEITRYLLC